MVRLRVHAASVDPVGWKLMAGGLAAYVPTHVPATIGWDVSDEVDAVGFDVREVAVGDLVMADAQQDVVWRGTTAEYVIVAVRAVAHVPEDLTMAEAASLPLAGQTMPQAVDRVGVREGETLLVHNASGGVGSLAAQYALSLGARVIATASPARHEALRSLGAEPVAYGDGRLRHLRGRSRRRQDRRRDGPCPWPEARRSLPRGPAQSSPRDRELLSARSVPTGWR